LRSRVAGERPRIRWHWEEKRDAKRGVRPWAIKPERQSWHRKRRVGEVEGEVEERKTKMSKEHPGRFYAVVVMISKYQKPPKLQRSIVSGLKGIWVVGELIE